MKNHTWIDISQRLDARVACWPGDTPFSFRLAWTKAESGSVNVGSVTMSLHTGTHVDAPFHFDNDGRRIIDLDINVFIGPARVIHLENVDSISPDELSGFDLEGVSRLLIRTGAWSDRSVFPSEIPPIRPELAEFLAAKGIRLIGLDLPSVDPIDSTDLPAHHALAKHGVHILEGLVLDHVEPGDYELVALPLALVDADGSPVRAVLRPLG